jgi:hypothetical protein
VLKQHPTLPAILTTHELAYADDSGQAQLSDYGQQLWDQLIAGNDVHVHITNYQDHYYGGSAMIRLYRFDLARDVIDVSTISPWPLGQNSSRLNELNRLEVELTGPTNRFTLDVDFTKPRSTDDLG